jgi:hypothetical protein
VCWARVEQTAEALLRQQHGYPEARRIFTVFSNPFELDTYLTKNFEQTDARADPFPTPAMLQAEIKVISLLTGAYDSSLFIELHQTAA